MRIETMWLANKNSIQFSVAQIEYPLGGSSKKGSHVYFLLKVFCIILLFCQIVLLFDINVVLMLPWWPDVTIVQSDVTILVPWQLSTGSKDDYLFCYCPLVGILFEVLRIAALAVFAGYLAILLNFSFYINHEKADKCFNILICG